MAEIFLEDLFFLASPFLSRHSKTRRTLSPRTSSMLFDRVWKQPEGSIRVGRDLIWILDKNVFPFYLRTLLEKERVLVCRTIGACLAPPLTEEDEWGRRDLHQPPAPLNPSTPQNLCRIFRSSLPLIKEFFFFPQNSLLLSCDSSTLQHKLQENAFFFFIIFEGSRSRENKRKFPKRKNCLFCNPIECICITCDCHTQT